MDLGLTGKRALVCGASRGIGAGIARKLAEEGAVVLAAARDQRAIASWIAELDPAVRGRVTAVELDLSKLESVDGLAQRLRTEGGVDILVNNSSGPPPMTAQDAKRADWLAQFEIMAASIFHLSQHLLPQMIERKWGRILTIASSGVEQPLPRLALSNGIRSAIVGWSKTLSSEVARHGVTVNVMLPGRIETARTAQIDSANAAREGITKADARAASEASIPAGRYGTVEEFASVAAFLCSTAASYVTGSKIRVDGGAIRSI